MLLQAKVHTDYQLTSDGRRRHGTKSPSSSQDGLTHLTPGSQTSRLQIWETIHFHYLSCPVCVTLLHQPSQRNTGSHLACPLTSLCQQCPDTWNHEFMDVALGMCVFLSHRSQNGIAASYGIYTVHFIEYHPIFLQICSSSLRFHCSALQGPLFLP